MQELLTRYSTEYGDEVAEAIAKSSDEVAEVAAKGVDDLGNGLAKSGDGAASAGKLEVPDAPDIVTKGTGEATDNFVGGLRGIDVELPNVKSESIDYIKRPRSEYQTLRNEFDSKVRRDFLQDIASDSEKLRAAGFTESDILDIADGYVPDGWQVHHKLPLDDGGTNSFDNLVLIQNEPYHKVITNHQNSVAKGFQIGELNQVEWPMIDGRFYPPTH